MSLFMPYVQEKCPLEEKGGLDFLQNLVPVNILKEAFKLWPILISKFFNY